MTRVRAMLEAIDWEREERVNYVSLRDIARLTKLDAIRARAADTPKVTPNDG